MEEKLATPDGAFSFYFALAIVDPQKSNRDDSVRFVAHLFSPHMARVYFLEEPPTDHQTPFDSNEAH